MQSAFLHRRQWRLRTSRFHFWNLFFQKAEAGRPSMPRLRRSTEFVTPPALDKRRRRLLHSTPRLPCYSLRASAGKPRPLAVNACRQHDGKRRSGERAPIARHFKAHQKQPVKSLTTTLHLLMGVSFRSINRHAGVAGVASSDWIARCS